MPEGAEWIVGPDQAFRVRASDEYVVLHDYWLPRVIELSANGASNDGPDPETYARVEVNDDGIPRLVELRITVSDPDSAGIRQTDLREIEVRAVLEDLVAGFTFRIERGPDGEAVRAVTWHKDAAGHLRLVMQRRAGSTARDITPELLERVAKVYRDNIAKYPTKAVQHHFQVSQRMAAEYVSRARKRGLLPPTKKGKKNA